MERIKDRLKRIPKPIVALAIVILVIMCVGGAIVFAALDLETREDGAYAGDGTTLPSGAAPNGVGYNTPVYYSIRVYNSDKTQILDTLETDLTSMRNISANYARQIWKDLNPRVNPNLNEANMSEVDVDVIYVRCEVSRVIIREHPKLKNGDYVYTRNGVKKTYSGPLFDTANPILHDTEGTPEQIIGIYNGYRNTAWDSSGSEWFSGYSEQRVSAVDMGIPDVVTPTDPPTPTPTTAPGKIRLTIKDDYYNESGNILQKTTTRKSEDVEAGKDYGQFTYLIASARAYKAGDAGCHRSFFLKLFSLYNSRIP